MANDGFNGATITFPTNIFGGLRGIEFSESGPKVNVTGSIDTETTYRSGIADPQLVATFVGGLPSSGADIGTQAELAITWPDGTSDGSMTLAIIVDRSTGGSMDGEMTSSITFAPTVAG
jgi:hypothetical protein